MIYLSKIAQAKFQFGQKVQTSTGQSAYICGVIYYADSRQWHYALSFETQDSCPDEVWYQERDLSRL